MKIVLDVENTISEKKNGKKDLSPYNLDNKLVSVGFTTLDQYDNIDETHYYFFYHKDLIIGANVLKERFEIVQSYLDKCDLLIGHNLKHDLSWLIECGWKYDGPLYDTMLAEYVLSRGAKVGLSLSDSCKRRYVQQKKSELIDKYMKDGVLFDAIPVDIVEEYGIGDIRSTSQLYQAQQEAFEREQNAGLVPTMDMTNAMCGVITHMESDGICIDMDALSRLETEYKQEYLQLQTELQKIAHAVMGDTNINLASYEQLSEVIYGRRVVDKNRWARTFDLGSEMKGSTRKAKYPKKMSLGEFRNAVATQTTRLFKTVASQCTECTGKGLIQKFRKDGTPYKKMNKCPSCEGEGIQYTDTEEYAGLGINPPSSEYVSASGFTTNKEYLSRLARQIEDKDSYQYRFLEGIRRINAVSTYLDTFIEAIKNNVQYENGVYILRSKFNQHVTSTGRLSSSEPNFQNMPRGGTFPVRKAIISRFDNGLVMEADYSRLEYTAAVYLAQDRNGTRDILNGVDAHAFTRDRITEAGQPIDRTTAKAHTFKPLYGGLSGTEAEQEYYKAFMQKHEDIAKWHDNLIKEAVNTRKIRLPTGREYDFKFVKVYPKFVTNSTQIKNYPVQGFATADIVPLACIRAFERLKHMNSVLFITVHDSIGVDVYPGELEQVKEILIDAMEGVVDTLYELYAIKFNIPLQIEIKAGPNWMETEEIYATPLDTALEKCYTPPTTCE